MQIENFRLVNKGPIICSFNILFPKMGMTIRDFRLMQSNGKKWIAPPSRQYTDEHGAKKFFSFVAFQGTRKQDFDNAVMKLLEPHLLVTTTSLKENDPSEELPF